MFVFFLFFYITVQTLLAHWLRASIVYEGKDNGNGVVLRHPTRGAFHEFNPTGYEGNYDHVCIFLTWSCLVKIYSSIACDN